jgi:hypothetical protein
MEKCDQVVVEAKVIRLACDRLLESRWINGGFWGKSRFESQKIFRKALGSQFY